MALGRVPGVDDEEDSEGVFSDINITPLTDIFLVLLIIFMVTSSVIVNQNTAGNGRSGIKVNLPQGNASDVTAAESDVSVAILTDGRVAVNGDVVTEEELRKLLDAAKQHNPNTLVIIQADEGVPHGRVVQVMEQAKAAGLAQLAIGVREGPKP